MEKNPLIITIGREYGSGGRRIGKALAEKLGISFYDKEIIALAAKNTGLSDAFIADNEQKSRSGFLRTLSVPSGYSAPFHFTPLDESIFLAESEVIRKIAAGESAVIVGRCADYILGERENTIHVFIYAPMDFRTKRIMELDSIDEAAAIKKIAASDKERGNHYFRYTDQKWGKATNYDICMNSALLGLDKTADILADLARTVRS